VNAVTLAARRQNLGADGGAANPEEKIKMKQLLKNLLNDESGQDLIEYALIAALIALAAIGAMQTVGSKIGNEFNAIGSDI
jgi:pilus assembly protein Flp/PilA